MVCYLKAARRGRRTLVGAGVVACLAVVLTSGLALAAGRVAPSVVTATGAFHGSFTVTNPNDPNQCALVRDRGMMRVAVQKLTSRGVVAGLLVEGRPGHTTHLSAATDPPVAGVYGPSPSKMWVTETITDPTTGRVDHFGSGTLKMSADGRSGSFRGVLVPDTTVLHHATGKVHVAAHWDCTSRIGRLSG